MNELEKSNARQNEDYKLGYAEGFKSAREKAAGMMEDHGCSDCTDAIRKMEP